MTLTLDLARRRTLLIAMAGGIGALLSKGSVAATWPSQAIRVVLPFPAGGTADAVARLLSEKLAGAFSSAVVVDPKPGANGIIASTAVAKANADGHTLLFASAAHTSNASLYPKLPYDTVRDFVPVAQVVPPGPMVIAVHPAVPVRTVGELIAFARANPGAISYGSAGVGNTLHLAGEMLTQMANIKLLHVPYRGGAPALTDLVSGQIQLMFNSALVVAPYVKDGRIRLIAQTGSRRSSALPDLATVDEAGLPGFEVTGWFGLFAPAKTPIDVIEKINRESNRAMALPELRDKLSLLGTAEAPSLTADQFAAFTRAEMDRYAKVIKNAGLSLDTPKP